MLAGGLIISWHLQILGAAAAAAAADVLSTRLSLHHAQFPASQALKIYLRTVVNQSRNHLSYLTNAYRRTKNETTKQRNNETTKTDNETAFLPTQQSTFSWRPIILAECITYLAHQWTRRTQIDRPTSYALALALAFTMAARAHTKARDTAEWRSCGVAGTGIASHPCQTPRNSQSDCPRRCCRWRWRLRHRHRRR